jgi:hypothetical protein
VHGGAWALQVTSNVTSAASTGFNSPASNNSAIQAGRTLTATCWAYATSANLKTHAKVSEAPSGSGSWATRVDFTSPTLAVNTWTKVSASATVSATGDQVIMSMYSNNQTSATGAIVYDDCSFTVV